LPFAQFSLHFIADQNVGQRKRQKLFKQIVRRTIRDSCKFPSREFVQEQHSMMGKADSAWAGP
jgi:hypothetical protein